MYPIRRLLLRVVGGLRSSYWFVPSVMALGAILLAWLAVSADSWVVANEVKLFPARLLSFDTDGARAFLTTVAGSMITVAGVAFSITMVAMTLASQQFGPRLLGNFMRDRGNQFVLGTFIATFLYCLLLLPALRRFSEMDALPELALSLAIVGTLGSLGVFIYFIHHAATSIRVQTMIERVSDDMSQALEEVWSERGGERGGPNRCGRELFEACDRGEPVLAELSGYLQSVNVERLVEAASDADAVFRRDARLGRYVVSGTSLGWMLRGDAAAADESRQQEGEELHDRVRAAFELGARRNLTQDLEAASGQLVELAVRALSPGINDPITAIHCVDVLAAALARVLARPRPANCHRDDAGAIRVLVPEIGFPRWLDSSFHQIRQAARGNAAVTLRLLERLVDLGQQSRREEDQEAIRRHAEILLRSGTEALPEPFDRVDVEKEYAAVIESLTARRSVRPAGTP